MSEKSNMGYRNKYIKFVASVLIILFGACISDDKLILPPLEINVSETSILKKRDIGSILGDLGQKQRREGQNGSVTYSDSGIFMEGYVVSTDKTGNFFEQLILQDTPQNPTAGIRVLIDVNALHTKYELGRKVYLRLDGLSVGMVNGIPSIGVLSRNLVDKIPSFEQDEIIIRTNKVEKVEPLLIGIDEISNKNLNLYVKINEVQFSKSNVLGDKPLTFAAEPTDQFNGERMLQSCITGHTLMLSTSTFSDFKGLRLPKTKGSISGIVSKNFFGNTYTIVINEPSGLQFENTNRCEVKCGLKKVYGSNSIFFDDFETQKRRKPISGNGWTNYVQEGSKVWRAYIDQEDNPSQGISARVNSFMSEEERNIAWLITPEIDLDKYEGETLSFETSGRFGDGSQLDVIISKNWKGNPEKVNQATWNVFSEIYIVHNDDPFEDWFSSGLLDLSCETGKVHIAFRYTGSGNEDFDGTYELDNIKINRE